MLKSKDNIPPEDNMCYNDTDLFGNRLTAPIRTMKNHRKLGLRIRSSPTAYCCLSAKYYYEVKDYVERHKTADYFRLQNT